MTQAYRRKLHELVARYRLEPTLRDIYVEGDLDKRMLDWLFREKSASRAVVYECKCVEISAGDLAVYGLPDNERSRAIWIAIELSRALGQSTQCVTCVADRDYDDILSRAHRCGLLLYTDPTSIECYLFDAGLLQKPLKTGASASCDCNALCASMTPVLHSMFAIRATNVHLGWGMKWIDPSNCLNLNGDQVTFDENEYIKRYLNSNSRLGSSAEFLERYKEVRTKVLGLAAFRGKDAFDLLAWALKEQKCDRAFCNPAVLIALAVSAMDAVTLLKHALFAQIMVRVTT